MSNVEMPKAAIALSEETQKTVDAVAAAQKSYNEMMTAGFEQSRQKYAQAEQSYLREIQNMYAELNERSQQAYKAYAEALNAAYTSAPSYEAFVQECRAYLERMQQLYGGANLQQRAQKVYETYLGRVAADPAQTTGGDAIDTLRRELGDIYSQQTLRLEVESAQGRYVTQLQRLSKDAQERQAQAYRDLLAALEGIWSHPELVARTQATLNTFTAAAREVVIACHATVEQSSAKAVEALSGDKGSPG